MRRIGKVLLWLVASLVVVIVVVVAAHVVNQSRYPEPEVAFPHPQDASTYPTELPEVEIAQVAEGPVRGFHLRPEDIRHEGVVLTWGGSEGGPDFEHAQLLAREGHEVLSLFYFGQPEQQPTLDQVPIETLQRGIDWAEANAEQADPVTIIGTSKGAELAALLPTYEPRVDNVVLFAPNDHVTQGMNQRSVASSWTYGGEDVPYVAFADGEGYGPMLGLMFALALGYPMHLRPVYEAALAAPEAAKARIDVTRVPGELLVFAGGDDQLWPADYAARRLEQARPDRTEVHIYDNAGHVFSVPGDYADGMRAGGSAEANAAAREASDQILVDRLAGW